MNFSQSQDEVMDLDTNTDSGDSRQQNGEYSPWPSSNGPALAEPQNDTLEGACAADYSNEEGPSDLPISCHQSCEIGQINLSSIFQILEDSAVSLLKDELKKSEHYLSQGYPVTSELHMEDDNDMDSDEHFQDNSAREGVRMMTRNFLRVMNKHDLADRLEKNENVAQ
ncbi:NACHT, LRR and PYD domains-containing protein 12-like isoform X1 [Arapaima gigas]